MHVLAWSPRAARPRPRSWATRCCAAAGGPGSGYRCSALPLLLSGMVTGGFLSSSWWPCALLLWLPPARDWFAGRAAPRPPEPRAFASHRPDAARGSAGPAGPADRPAADDRLRHPARGLPGPSRSARPAAERPPAAGVWACALTWCFAGSARWRWRRSRLPRPGARHPARRPAGAEPGHRRQRHLRPDDHHRDVRHRRRPDRLGHRRDGAGRPAVPRRLLVAGAR